ncbi:MAG: hypothetical protein IJZ75_06040 [Clostridia bacterium]|nr:hypothetical protein [Clostridia bacterium]
MSNLINKCNCIGLSVITSIAVGVIAAVLLYTAVITVAPVFYWVLFGIAVGFLAIALLVSSRTGAAYNQVCLRLILIAFLVGVLGTIATALILLGVGFAATSIIGAIIFGVLLFFFTLLLTSVAAAVKYFSVNTN